MMQLLSRAWWLLVGVLPVAAGDAGGAPATITELHVVATKCPTGTSHIDAVVPWTGDFADDNNVGGGGLYLCAGRGSAGGITALQAIGAASSAQARCPPDFTLVSGESGLSPRGFVALCASRNASRGPGINMLSGVLSHEHPGCPVGLAPVGGTDHRQALLPNMTVCHGYACTAAQQGELCPQGTPGAADRDFRCCDLKMVSGPQPGSPAPKCTGPPPEPGNMTVCHGYSCTPEQQGELCPKGTPGAADRDFRCCAGRLISGQNPGDPAPNCSAGTAFLFGPSSAQVLLCSGSLQPCPTTTPSTNPITELRALFSTSRQCCPAGFEQVTAAYPATSGWTSDFQQDSGMGGFVILCVGRNKTVGRAPLTGLVAFSDPSAADPGGQCPAGWEMLLGNSSTDCLGTNADGGCVHLCGQRTEGAPPLTRLAGVERASGASCPVGSEALMGPGSGGQYTFDPRGGGITLCATTAGEPL